jgi:hypothetical protein
MPAIVSTGTRASALEGAVSEPPDGGARRLLVPLAQALQKGDMRRLGLRRTKALARAFNRRTERAIDFRRSVYEQSFEPLLDENGGVPAERLRLRDGFVVDESGSLPHLDEVLASGAELIEQYGGRKWEHEKPFLQNVIPPEAIARHPALLDFATSSALLAAVTPSFGYVPVLSGLLPRGVRLMESSTEFDPDPGGPWRESQLYHLDYHSSPTVYVIVALRDIAPEYGPLHFIGKAASRRVAEALDYGARGVPYRLDDETVDALVAPDEVHRFAVRAGTVLVIESSACFHFGSRRPAKPRYQLQYAFTSPRRDDFMELWRPRLRWPVSPADSSLRRLVLDPGQLGLG